MFGRSILRKIVKVCSVPVGGTGAISLSGIVFGSGHVNTKTQNFVKPSELPIYEDPTENLEFEIQYQPVSKFEENISIARKTVWETAAKMESTYVRVIQFYETGVAHTQNVYAYLTDDENMVPRAVAITVGGLTGLLTAARGGLVKKVTYSGIGMLGVASLCYPKQTVDISQRSYNIIKKEGLGAINNVSEPAVNYVKNALGMSNTKNVPVIKVAEEKLVLKENKNDTEKESTPIQIEGDIGQSNPEDKDMYTTRG